jgi:hypothetical protein
MISEGGGLPEAEELYRRSLSANEQTLGTEHPITLTSLANLAWALEAQGKLSEAEQLSRRALEARTRTLGSDSPSTINSINNLAFLLVRLGRAQAARALFVGLSGRFAEPVDDLRRVRLGLALCDLLESGDRGPADEIIERVGAQLGDHHRRVTTGRDRIEQAVELRRRRRA